MRFAGLARASYVFVAGRPDGELIAVGTQAARTAVMPLHENLKLVCVPHDAHAANAHSALLDLISLIWDLVVPAHEFSPGLRAENGRGHAALAPCCLIDSSIDA
jgi:hypothetical protein